MIRRAEISSILYIFCSHQLAAINMKALCRPHSYLMFCLKAGVNCFAPCATLFWWNPDKSHTCNIKDMWTMANTRQTALFQVLKESMFD